MLKKYFGFISLNYLNIFLNEIKQYEKQYLQIIPKKITIIDFGV
jgi:hypothetical protein